MKNQFAIHTYVHIMYIHQNFAKSFWEFPEILSTIENGLFSRFKFVDSIRMENKSIISFQTLKKTVDNLHWTNWLIFKIVYTFNCYLCSINTIYEWKQSN